MRLPYLREKPVLMSDYSCYNSIISDMRDDLIHSRSVFFHNYRGCPIIAILDEFVRIGWIIPTNSTRDSFQITEKGKEAFVGLPREFENNPYGHFKDQQKREADAEKSHRWYLQQDAKQRFDDYPTVKRQRNWAAVIAAVSILVNILALILKKG